MSPARLLAKSLTDCKTREDWKRSDEPCLMGGYSAKYHNEPRNITVWRSYFYSVFSSSEHINTPFLLTKAEEKIVREALSAFDRRASEDRQAEALARLTAPVAKRCAKASRSAAPELYEALEDALKFILGDISGESQRIRIIKAGTDALVKADGEQP